jgi:hypothetical protein
MPRDPWRNAQNRDRPEMSMAQSGFYDTKRGWVESSRRLQCVDLPSPGSYPAIAGASIAAGATGPVVYDGTVYQIKNHSQCAVRFGDRVGLFVSPNCEAFFVPCVCGCDEPAPTLACEKMYSICIAGQTHILGIGSIFNTCWLTCCTLSGTTIEICGYLTCNPATNQIYFQWFIGGGLGGFSGQIELVDLFSTGSATETLDLGAYEGLPDCDVVINAADELIDCTDCSGDPPSNPCCALLLWFCLNGESVQLPVDGGDHTFDVATCCDTCTTSATMRIRLQCNQETGTISLQWDFVCDGGTPESGVTSELSSFCSSNDPRIVTLTNGEVPCFLQLQVSINDAGCDDCGPSPTTEAPPP